MPYSSRNAFENVSCQLKYINIFSYSVHTVHLCILIHAASGSLDDNIYNFEIFNFIVAEENKKDLPELKLSVSVQQQDSFVHKESAEYHMMNMEFVR